MMKHVMQCVGLVCVMLLGGYAQAAAPIVTDSRIRTYIYNANEVFKVTTEYGYQSNIELAKDEKVDTMSLGDVSGFKITPNGNRIFLRALKPDFHTNMTLITNKRVYHFDLTSFVERNEDIMYVLRFYYPEHDVDTQTGVPLDAAAYLRPAPREASAAPVGLRNVPARGATPPPPPVASFSPPRELPSAPVPPRSAPPAFAPPPSPRPAQAAAPQGRNLAYSLQGSDRFAPWQVFDENGRTFVQFPEGVKAVPPMYAAGPQGRPVPLPAQSKDGYFVINGVFDRFFIGQGADQVTVFNDRRSASAPPPSRNGLGA